MTHLHYEYFIWTTPEGEGLAPFAQYGKKPVSRADALGILDAWNVMSRRRGSRDRYRLLEDDSWTPSLCPIPSVISEE